ncbi:hypothetical protein ACFV28_02170 [Streptomyces sp. NPDC059720]|uniref:hypothetical protein n=1 Tax=Streptomyces sp. NPDC059720 TaxID=3346924 RepID=UPI003697A55C
MSEAGMAAPARVGAADAFLRACRYEWRHLAALTSTWVLLGTVGMLSLLTGITVLVDGAGQSASPVEVADTIMWNPLATQIPALCFFVLVLGTGPVSTDIISGAARTTWLSVNGPRTAYTAKCAVGFATGVAVAAASALLGAASCAIALRA